MLQHSLSMMIHARKRGRKGRERRESAREVGIYEHATLTSKVRIQQSAPL